MKHKRQNVTIQDVAKAAGVSVSTVSRVLNGKADVASNTQDRILSVIGELGYTSNLAARSMRSRKNNLIGMVVPDIGVYSIEIMKGVNRAIAESSYDLLLYTTGDWQKHGAAIHEQQYISLLNGSITDGMLIAASSAQEFVTDAPIVAVDPHIINPNYPCVQGMNYEGAIEATNYLIGLGHRRIGFIGGRAEIGSAEQRLRGYREALQKANIEIDNQLITEGDFTQKTAHKCARQLLALNHPPTAIFASNDQSAIGAYQAADELGIQIPSRLSVVGFDNISEASFMGLTTIDQHLTEMGYVATRMLMKLINGEKLDLEIYKMQTKLVVRTSCQKINTSE
jgi:LacI family transcriptional regulator